MQSRGAPAEKGGPRRRLNLAPSALVAVRAQVAQAAADEGVPLAAENALARFDRTAYDTVMRNAFPSGGGGTPQFVSFTYLRKGGGLFHPSNWHQFVRFARRLAQVDDSVEESDQLEALYNVAGDAAMVYHHQHSARR